VSEIRSYRDLLVWEQAMELAAAIYRLTHAWPKEELYGLTSQARRAAASVPANIAGSYLQFLKVAQGSLKKLETHLLIAERIDIAKTDELAPALAQCERVGKLLRGPDAKARPGMSPLLPYCPTALLPYCPTALTTPSPSAPLPAPASAP
jgi:four helix bundle protein